VINLDYNKNGIMEDWNNGIMGLEEKDDSLFIIPVFHYSITENYYDNRCGFSERV
jgi:hypothetical protein